MPNFASKDSRLLFFRLTSKAISCSNHTINRVLRQFANCHKLPEDQSTRGRPLKLIPEVLTLVEQSIKEGRHISHSKLRKVLFEDHIYLSIGSINKVFMN